MSYGLNASWKPQKCDKTKNAFQKFKSLGRKDETGSCVSKYSISASGFNSLDEPSLNFNGSTSAYGADKKKKMEETYYIFGVGRTAEAEDISYASRVDGEDTSCVSYQHAHHVNSAPMLMNIFGQPVKQQSNFATESSETVYEQDFNKVYCSKIETETCLDGSRSDNNLENSPIEPCKAKLSNSALSDVGHSVKASFIDDPRRPLKFQSTGTISSAPLVSETNAYRCRPTIPEINSVSTGSTTEKSAQGLRSVTPGVLVGNVQQIVENLNTFWTQELMSIPQYRPLRSRFYATQSVFELAINSFKRYLDGDLPDTFENIFALMHLALASACILCSEDANYPWDELFEDILRWRNAIDMEEDVSLFYEVVHVLWASLGNQDVLVQRQGLHGLLSSSEERKRFLLGANVLWEGHVVTLCLRCLNGIFGPTSYSSS